MRATVRRSGGRYGTGADGHNGDQGLRVKRMLDTNSPGLAIRVCGVAGDVAACRQAKFSVVQRSQKLRGALRCPSLHDPARIKPAATVARWELDGERAAGD